MVKKVIIIVAPVLVILGVLIILFISKTPPALSPEANVPLNEYIVNQYHMMQDPNSGQPLLDPPAYSIASSQKAPKVTTSATNETWCVTIQPTIKFSVGSGRGVLVTLAHYLLIKNSILWTVYGADTTPVSTTVGKSTWLAAGCTNW